jgi:tetratricopeptide (TPR) repeat protein
VYPENDIPTMPEVPVADLPLELPAAQEAIPDPPITGDEDDRVMLELAEIDLSSALSGLLSSSPQPPVSFVRASAGEPPAETPASHVEEAPATVEEPAPDLEDVFAQMRAKSAREQQASAALAQYDQATQLIEQGLDKEAIAALEAASRVPMMRFRAATRLGRLLIDRGDLNDGVEWLERAAEAPPPSPEEGYDLLYELAGALEAQGESARALAILMELDAESDGYRDVRTRIVYLSRAQQAESHRP